MTETIFGEEVEGRENESEDTISIANKEEKKIKNSKEIHYRKLLAENSENQEEDDEEDKSEDENYRRIKKRNNFESNKKNNLKIQYSFKNIGE